MDVDRDLNLFNPITKPRENETIKIFYFFLPFGFLKKKIIYLPRVLVFGRREKMNMYMTSIHTSPKMLEILIVIDFLCYRIRLIAEGGRAKGKGTKKNKNNFFVSQIKQKYR